MFMFADLQVLGHHMQSLACCGTLIKAYASGSPAHALAAA